MKSFNRIMIGLLLGFGLLCWGSLSQAGSIPRSPKEVFVSSWTTGAYLISPAISTNAVGGAAFQPGAVYDVILGTGALNEFIVLVDSGNCDNVTTTVAKTALGVGASFIGPRIFYSSAAVTTTIIPFDPPLFFHNGLCAIDSAVTGQFAITYELGRGLTGN